MKSDVEKRKKPCRTRFASGLLLTLLAFSTGCAAMPPSHPVIELLAIDSADFHRREDGYWVLSPNLASNVFKIHLDTLQKQREFYERNN